MKIFDYEEVVMNWDSYTYPIAVGTPVSVDGVLADNSSAHGLIARTVFAKPDGGDTLKIMTGGFIDMEEIVAGYGQELSSAAVQALCGIHFYKNGKCISTGGGGSDDQKWHDTTTEQLFSETVTTVASELSDEGVASLSYSNPITADTIKVTFDGVEYICEKHISMDDNIYVYGGFDGFSEYPFYIESEDRGGDTAINEIHTATAGTHTVSATTDVVITTDTFKQAVNDIAGWKTETSEQLFSETVTTVLNNGVNEATLDYSTLINSDTLTVTYDGVEYTCPKNFDGYGNSYYGGSFDKSTGSMDFTNFPFQIYSYVDENTGNVVNTLATETAGEHTVVVVGENTTYTPTFVEGVKKNSAFIVHFSLNNEEVTADKTASEILQAYNNDYFVIGVYPSNPDYKEVYYLQNIDIGTGGVTFLSFAVAVNDTVASASIKFIISDPEDVNLFIVSDVPLKMYH